MTPTRQERRTRERERTRAHARLYARGVAGAPDGEDTVLLAHLLGGLLARRADRHRAARAAEAAHRVFDATLAQADPPPALACQRGCTYCCSLFVSAAAPEVLRLAAAIRRTPDPHSVAARVTAARAGAEGVAIGARAHRPVPCGLLAEDLCGFYDARPLGCRGHVSLAVDACLASMSEPATKIPTPALHVRAGRACKLALFAALRAAGLPDRSYELNAALERALAEEDAEERWLAGEDPFVGVPQDPTRTAETEALIARIAARAG